MKITEKQIKKLIKSPVPEDIALGIGFMIKKHKIRKNKDLEERLKKCVFKIEAPLDLYISRFNVYICKYWRYTTIQVYSVRRVPNTMNYPILKA